MEVGWECMHKHVILVCARVFALHKEVLDSIPSDTHTPHTNMSVCLYVNVYISKPASVLVASETSAAQLIR